MLLLILIKEECMSMSIMIRPIKISYLSCKIPDLEFKNQIRNPFFECFHNKIGMMTPNKYRSKIIIRLVWDFSSLSKLFNRIMGNLISSPKIIMDQHLSSPFLSRNLIIYKNKVQKKKQKKEVCHSKSTLHKKLEQIGNQE